MTYCLFFTPANFLDNTINISGFINEKNKRSEGGGEGGDFFVRFNFLTDGHVHKYETHF